jgi:hypothetical protein
LIEADYAVLTLIIKGNHRYTFTTNDNIVVGESVITVLKDVLERFVFPFESVAAFEVMLLSVEG